MEKMEKLINLFQTINKNDWEYLGVGKVGQLFGPDKYVHVYEHKRIAGKYKYKNFRNGLRIR